MKKETKAIHTPFQRRDAYDALQMPVYHTLAFEFDNADIMADAFCGRTDAPDYSRVLNPTVTHFESRIASLTGAKEVSAFTSGMAAISAMLLSTASAGKNIISSSHLFGNTYLLLTRTLARYGVEARLTDLTDPTAVEALVDGDTCCIFLESVTNPQTEVADVRALSEIARRHGFPLIADTTMIPFTQFDGRKLGLDFQVVSTTKYVSGGATSLGGVIIDYGNFPEISTFIKKDCVFNLGGYMTPHAAYMQTLGLETLQVRYDRQAATALRLARLLEQTPGVVRVGYPGLESHPQHELFREQYGEGAGAMLTFDLESGEACRRFINRLQLIHRATNLFDNRSLAIHPASTIFGPLTQEQRDAMDVKDTTIRLSVGLEDAEDLYADICRALGDLPTDKLQHNEI
ncbi:MAG: aminotransferase class I/II-fold pyridoxal phosphate-dependent enzyme [Muribaculaceae bacterium]|nr:aminotransferase class I/II-fold pyridoxal phosphate-dependent enzyme [Muribaculaceae bacterium]